MFSKFIFMFRNFFSCFKKLHTKCLTSIYFFCFSRFIELSPTNLYATYCQLPSARPTLPCNGFRRTYASLCDFYKQIFRDEIVWVSIDFFFQEIFFMSERTSFLLKDVEKIYSLHNCTVLRLDDFSHLSPK